MYIVFRNNTMRIVKIDLNDNSLAEFDLALDTSRSMYTSICLIPDKSIFIYGNYKIPSSAAFIIDSNNNASPVINAPLALHAPGLIYYKNYIYVFGGWNGSIKLSHAFNYNLKNKTWTPLNSMPTPAHVISIICRNNQMLLSGYDHSKIYSYDIAQNKYTPLYDVQANFRKIVCENKTNAYVIEMGGYIYESNHEWKIWNNIGNSGIENNALMGAGALWKNKMYFALISYNLYEFDLNTKRINLVKKI